MAEPLRPFIRAITRVNIGRREMYFTVDGDRPAEVASALEERVRAYCESESAATLEAADVDRVRQEGKRTAVDPSDANR